MFCPLCKAEFRQGFRQCSDCHVSLVGTANEASSIPTECLWQGSDREECNRVLTALVDADIPHLSRELVKSQPWPWLSFFLVRFMTPRPTYELKIWILQSDVDRASQATRKAETVPDD
jgi:hypothetical protein